MKNSISFFALCIFTLSFLSCGKEDLQPAAGDNFYDQSEIQDVLNDHPVDGDNFYDQNDLQDILADDQVATNMRIMTQRDAFTSADDDAKKGITAADLIISRIPCGEGFAPVGGVKLIVHDPNDRDIKKYNSREYQVQWIYSDKVATTTFNGIATDCLCEGMVKVVVQDFTTKTSASIQKDLTGTCGLNPKSSEI